MSKEIVKEVSETFKRIVREAGDAAKKADTFDKSLGEKIRKVGESGGQVVKHIEERSDSKRS
jgi:hypothetical protein